MEKKEGDPEDYVYEYGFSGQIGEDRDEFGGYYYALYEKEIAVPVDFEHFDDEDDSDDSDSDEDDK